MSDTNPLALSLPQGGQIQKFSEEDILAVSKNSDFLPRIQVMGASSEVVKEGKFPMGEFALVDGNNMVSLGKEFDAISIAIRTKALRINPSPMSYYDRSTEAFQQVAKEAEVKDSGCMFGPEYLFWVPSKSKFATFFCGTKTGRKEAPSIFQCMKPEADKPLQPATVTLKVHFIKTDSYSWHGFKCVPCSTPPAVLPDNELLLEVVEKFNNPVDSKIEAVAPAQQPSRAR